MYPHFRNLMNSTSAHHVTAMFQSNLTHSQMCAITLDRIYVFQFYVTLYFLCLNVSAT